MRLKNINNEPTINRFVSKKINKLKDIYNINKKLEFKDLYSFMFSEKNNILFEEVVNFKIKKTTYKDAFDYINKYSANLKYLLKDSNKIVGLYMNNSIDWIESFWMILKAGYKILIINTRIDDENINKIIDSVDINYVLCGDDLNPNLKCNLIKFSDIQNCNVINEVSNDDFGDEIFLMSSGTTENIKLCSYSATEFYYLVIESSNIIKNQRIVKRHYKGEMKLLAFLPFYHIFGLVAMYLWFGFFSRTFVKLNRMDADTILNTIKRHEVTHIFAVPLLWQKVYYQAMEKIKDMGMFDKYKKALKIKRFLGNSLLGRLFTKLAFKKIRDNLFGESIIFMISGGSMIEKEVLEFFNAIGYHLANGYGMSEVAITSFELAYSYKILTSTSIGKPFSSVEYKINDEGELLIRGKTTSQYILINGEKFNLDDWYNSHDRARCIKGRYYLDGRSDDLIILKNAENLNPYFVEEKLDKSIIDGLKDVCVFNNINEDKDEIILLASVSRYLKIERIKEILTKIKQVLDDNKYNSIINKIVFTSTDLINNNEFKLNRKRIINDYKDNKYRIIDLDKKNDEVINEEFNEIEERIRSFFMIALNKDINEIGKDDSFFLDLGGTSLDYFMIISMIEKEFGKKIPTESLKYDSVKSISEYLEGKQ
ncbi:MAG: AMP-binding protein [Bacilli bacterium]|nr:AMP-binding protein [Bacilli bacterium]